MIVAVLLFGCISPVCSQTAKKTAPVKRAAPATGLPAMLRSGKLVYQKFCLSCHQVDGGGVPNLNPPIAGTSQVTGKKAALIKILLNGMQERVEIDGELYSNNMPPFKTLTDQQVADVLTYIRKSFGNNASTVTKTDVAQVRAGKVK
ncbi:cytochrome c [Niabella sp. CC-SYL272]|uniref:c-type cytochrome n=1 Tax=Niabella agricola TaxID=2891571 RepID=UPI001F285E27|nr:cytochrome c [Niabella agricola]MCF3110854.1 cytochrome c [Niabella agricola]